jgi:disulfide bond formation protein DsbB
MKRSPKKPKAKAIPRKPKMKLKLKAKARTQGAQKPPTKFRTKRALKIQPLTIKKAKPNSVVQETVPQQSFKEQLRTHHWLLGYTIFLQALVGMLGSLYYSTFGDPVKNLLAGTAFPAHSGFAPCELCWFARVLLYPMVVISMVGLLKEDKKFTDYIMPLAGLGVLLEFFHYGLQKWNFPNPFQCTLSVPCDALQVQYFGFVTIPFLAGIAFLVIFSLCALMRWAQSEE